MLQISLLKSFTRRNLYFGIAFVIFLILSLALFLYETNKLSSINGIVKLFENFYYIWILAIFSSDIDSGLIKKQISNGAKRIEILKQNLLIGLFFCSFFYITQVLYIFLLSIYYPEIQDYPRQFIGVTFLAYLELIPIALFISLFLKSVAKTVLIGHFVIKHLLALPTALMASKTFNDLYILASPQGLAQKVIYGSIALDNKITVPVLIFYFILFVFLCHFRLKKMNFL